MYNNGGNNNSTNTSSNNTHDNSAKARRAWMSRLYGDILG